VADVLRWKANTISLPLGIARFSRSLNPRSQWSQTGRFSRLPQTRPADRIWPVPPLSNWCSTWKMKLRVNELSLKAWTCLR